MRKLILGKFLLAKISSLKVLLIKQNVEKGYKEFWTHFFGGLEFVYFFYGQKGDNCHWVEKVLVPKVFDKCNGREVNIQSF